MFQRPGQVGASADDDIRAGLDRATAAYPTATVENRAQYIHDQLGWINTVLTVVDVLLAFSVLIALLGIANTLALSIHERTREIGLLRAIGMTRRQLRTTVRYESTIIAVFGTVLGLSIGLGFAWAMVKALHNTGINHFTIPGTQLVAIVAVGAVAGVLAAALPARRAARLNVLKAVATG
jgi:putative ABC transport system permease protein